MKSLPTQRTFSLSCVILIHCIAFTFITWLFLPNIDIDMFENYAWGQTFEWGSFKHPPFFVWVTRFWFAFFPANNTTYLLLSYLNAGIGLCGVLCLAQFLFVHCSEQKKSERQLHDFLLLVLGFSVLSLPFNFYAAIFNADSISLSLWPWTTYAFFSALHAENGKNKWYWTVLVSLLSAASMLGKYYSAVLLLTLFIISLSQASYRRWYASPYPYACLGLFILFLLPHAVWEYQMNFPFRLYYSRYLSVGIDKLLKHGLTFFLTGIYFYAFSWILWCVLKSGLKIDLSYPNAPIINKRLLLCLCLLPALITVIISVIGEISIKDRWAIPVWFALPIFMANQLGGAFATSKNLLKKISQFWLLLVVLIGVLFGFAVWGSYSYLSTHHDYLEARKEMVERIEERFKVLYPNQIISWAGGEVWPDHPAPLAIYLANHPRAVPGYPNQMPALVNPHHTWAKEYGVIICGKKYSDSQAVIQNCAAQTRTWLKSNNLSINEEEILYQAKGWRWYFLKSQERKVTVFWITPQRVSSSNSGLNEPELGLRNN